MRHLEQYAGLHVQILWHAPSPHILQNSQQHLSVPLRQQPRMPALIANASQGVCSC